MIIKEIPHKSAKARAKAENRQQTRALSNIAKSVGKAALTAFTKSMRSTEKSIGAKASKASRPRSVRATIEYALKGDNETQGELIYSQKLEMLEPEMIAIAMDTTSAMNQEVKNPCKHFVISWDEGEKPTRAQMTRSIATYLKYAGYEEHQAVAYLHTDTEKTHIHIIANHVHPETFKAVHRDFIRGKRNHKIRERVARQLEIENGWKRVEGKLHKLDKDGNLVERTYEEKILYSQTHSDKISDKSQRQESHSGKPSFERWCKESKDSDYLRKDIIKLISGKKVEWDDIHKILDKYNIEIKPDKYGKGLVVYDLREPDKCCIAASGLSRDLSAGNLGKVINTPYMPFVRSTERPTEALPPLTQKQNIPHPQNETPLIEAVESPAPAMTITARSEIIAKEYAAAAKLIEATDPAKAKILNNAAKSLRKQSNVREIVLPHPSAPVAEITTAMQGMGGRS